jgi:hypothetical protein
MTKFAKLLLLLSIVSVVSVEKSRADGWEVNNIWWNVIINYNNSGQTICLAEQFNNQTFTAVTFDVYPVPNAWPPRHGTATQRNMAPYTQYRIFGWLDGTKPDPKCVLTGWYPVGGKRVKVRPQDIQKSSRIGPW